MSSLTTFPASTITGTALPAGSTFDCSSASGVETDHSVYVAPIVAQTWPTILTCCGANAVQVSHDGCGASCVAKEAELQSLVNCFYTSSGEMQQGFTSVESLGCDDVSEQEALNAFVPRVVCEGGTILNNGTSSGPFGIPISAVSSSSSGISSSTTTISSSSSSSGSQSASTVAASNTAASNNSGTSTGTATHTSATSAVTGAASSVRSGNFGKFELAMVSMVFMGLVTGAMI